MEIYGRIIAVLPTRGGTSSKGTQWSVGSYVLETTEQFPKKMMFEVFGADKMQSFNIQEGEMLTVSFDFDAHEYQGKWYNSIRAWNVSRQQIPQQRQGAFNSPAPSPQQVVQQQMAQTYQQQQAALQPQSNSDLPF